MTTTAADIDVMLAADKTLFGLPAWIEAGATASLVSSVVDATGTVIGDLSLRLSATVETPIQRGDAVLVFEGIPLQRLAFRPDKFHVNPGKHPVPSSLRRLRLPPGRTRFYRWTDNRVWPRPADHRLAGAVLDEEPGTVTEAVQLFLQACGIRARLPIPPWKPRMEL